MTLTFDLIRIYQLARFFKRKSYFYILISTLKTNNYLSCMFIYNGKFFFSSGPGAVAVQVHVDGTYSLGWDWSHELFFNFFTLNVKTGPLSIAHEHSTWQSVLEFYQPASWGSLRVFATFGFPDGMQWHLSGSELDRKSDGLPGWDL